MRVTKIEQQNKNENKYNIFIDDNYVFSLHINDINYFKIKENEIISEEKYNYISENLMYLKAQDKAIKYIAFKLRTKNEVYLKLEENLFKDDIIEKVIDFLEKNKYIDDENFCELYMKESVKKFKGKFLIKVELRKKGISNLIIDNTFSNNPIDEVYYARNFVSRKFGNLDFDDFSKKKRIFSALQRRGYSYDIIKEVYENVLEDDFKGETICSSI